MRPQVGQEISRYARLVACPSASSRLNPAALTSSTGSAVRETRMVSPTPRRRSPPIPAADLKHPHAFGSRLGHPEVQRDSRSASAAMAVGLAIGRGDVG